MQLVLCKNRVVAYGESCFLAMGGTVICEETGKTYSNATIAECENIPCDIDRVGYEYHAGVFVPCAPFVANDDEGYIMVACKECATPKNSGRLLEEILGARLTVAAEPGSRIVCTNGEKTVYPKTKNGLWWCDLPAYGEWTITATLGDTKGTKTINVDVLKEYRVYFGSVLTVSYPAGATCTATNGESTLTAPDKSGLVNFVIYQGGNWTVRSELGETVAEETITMTGEENESKNLVVGLGAVATATAEEGATYQSGVYCSWAEISEYSKAISICGEIDRNSTSAYVKKGNTYFKFNIGDTKEFTLNGHNIIVRIVGFNHDIIADESAYSGSRAGITFEMKWVYPEPSMWMSGITNRASDYSTSYLRTETLSALYEALPSDLKSAVVQVAKATKDNTIYVDDFLFILSYYEIFGKDTPVEGWQYAFFKAGNPVGKNQHYYTRTVIDAPGTGQVTPKHIETNGAVGYYSHSYDKWHFAFSFCV